MDIGHYILKDDKTFEKIEVWDSDKNIIIENNLIKWAKSLKNKRIGFDKAGVKRISTVFLGIDHGFLQGEPILFETAIEENGVWDVVERYATYDEALFGHKKWVEIEKPR